jgi:hypothetical protein
VPIAAMESNYPTQKLRPRDGLIFPIKRIAFCYQRDAWFGACSNHRTLYYAVDKEPAFALIKNHISSRRLLVRKASNEHQIARTNPWKHACAQNAKANGAIGSEFFRNRIGSLFLGRDEALLHAPRSSVRSRGAHQGLICTV